MKKNSIFIKLNLLLLLVIGLYHLSGCLDESVSLSLPNLDNMPREEIKSVFSTMNLRYKLHFSDQIITSDEQLDKFVEYGGDYEAGDIVPNGSLIHIYTTVLPLTIDRLDEVKMDFTLENRQSFIDTGIGKVTLERTIDGDTAWFYDAYASDASLRHFKVRFLGIDTPESTIDHDPWGKAASNFVSGKLRTASEIILESVGARKDLYERYLAFVWIDGKLLNLEIIQEAYSNSTISSSTKYGNIFIQVSVAVSTTGRRFFGETDPNYNYN